MFKRMITEDWAVWPPVISFILIAGVFIVVTIRAIRLGKAEREHLENLPLDDSNTPEPSNRPRKS